jgi:hypothetical protein
VPYDERTRDEAASLAREQARTIQERLVAEDPTFAGSGLEDKNVTALVAYLLRLGTDITKPPPGETPPADAVASAVQTVEPAP